MKVDKKVEAQANAWQIEQEQRIGAAKNANMCKRKGYGLGDEQDSVDVGLAREIRQELEPERSNKVAQLKKLIESGQYKPDLQAVAKSFADTVDEEIFYGRLVNDDK